MPPWVEPDSLGGRIRRLRSERGLSLAQLAGGDFSRAFLHQVELGQSRPSIRVLRVIAGKLGAPVDYLLEGEHPALDEQIAVEQARIALARGRPARAEQILAPLLGSRSWPSGTEARLAYAQALMALHRRGQAEAMLAEEERLLTVRADGYRLDWLRAIRTGKLPPGGGEARVRRAERALRDGEPAAALEHFRAARVLYEDRPEVSAGR